MTHKAIVATVTSVIKPPESETLTVVTVDVAGATHQVVANLQEDGTPRWTEGEVCIYVEDGATIPQDVLEDRGYWEPGAKKGLLGGGSKNNRVKARAFAKQKNEAGEVTFEGFMSEGLLFKLDKSGDALFVSRRMWDGLRVEPGDDVSSYLGIQ